MDIIKIILWIVCAPFIAGALIAGWCGLSYGLGFCVAIVLEKIGIKIGSIKPKPMMLLGSLIGLPPFLTFCFFRNTNGWWLITLSFILSFAIIYVILHHKQTQETNKSFQAINDNTPALNNQELRSQQKENMEHSSQETTKEGVKCSWSLLEFAQLYGKMKVAPFINKATGEKFRSCAFVDSNNQVTLVAFSSKLGELTPKEIAEQKNDLQVVLLHSGTYKLCKANNKQATKTKELTFTKITGYGTIVCNECGTETKGITAFTHGCKDAWIGRQCQNCGCFCKEHNENEDEHTFGEAKEDFICPQCGSLIRKKEESIFKGNATPLFCPSCRSTDLSFYCEYMT